MNIVTEFGKFRYNRVPVGICTSGDIFQSKLDELIGDIEGSRYISVMYWYLTESVSTRIYTR